MCVRACMRAYVCACVCQQNTHININNKQYHESEKKDRKQTKTTIFIYIFRDKKQQHLAKLFSPALYLHFEQKIKCNNLRNKANGEIADRKMCN